VLQPTSQTIIIMQAFIGTHSLYSYDAKKKYGFQTELLAGIRGVASFAEQTQKTFCVEKGLLSMGDFVELNAGSQLRVGFFMDMVTLNPISYAEKM